jgi:hypothetical protein
MPWNQSLSEFDSTATTESEEQTPETTPRAWWLTAKERTVYRRMSPFSFLYLSDGKLMIGFDEAVAYIHDYMINNPPFDVRQSL